MIYKNTQIGYVAIIITPPFAVLSIFDIFTGGTVGWLDTVGFAIFVGGLVVFSTLTVEIDRRTFRFYFTFGFWKREFLLEDICSVEVVRNPVYYGVGIRYTPRGWLYNVSGLSAVELEIQGEGFIRVGTDEPERLKEALEQALQPT